MRAMKQTWSIGERKFKQNFKIRSTMFEALVQSILTYGAELWGWQEFEMLEKIQTQYFKWCLGLKREVPNYLILEEVKRRKIRVITGQRSVNYEKTIRKSENKTLLIECIKEMDRRNEINEGTSWDSMRTKYFERNGFSVTRMNELLYNEPKITQILTTNDEDNQKQQQYKRILASNYNKNYKLLMKPGLPFYLHRTNTNIKEFAKRRCEGNRYWET